MGLDFKAAVAANYSNERINEMAGTSGKDYIKAVEGGYSNDELYGLIENESTAVAKAKGTDSIFGTIGRGIGNTAEFLQSGFAENAALVNAIPANLYESLGINESGAKSAREGQKYWQDFRKEKQARLQEDYPEMVADIGSTLFSPSSLATLGYGGAVKSAAVAGDKPMGLVQKLMASPEVQVARTPAGFGGITATDEASRIAATGDMSGVTGQDIRDVAIAGGIGAVAPDVITKGAGKIYDSLGRPFGGVSAHAYNVGAEAGLSKDEVERIVRNIPADQQARYLAEIGGSRASGTFKGAVIESTQTRIAQGKSINKRAQQALKAVNAESYNGASKAIDEQYSVLREKIDFDNNGVEFTMNTDGFVEELASIRNSFLGTPLEGRIDGLANRINDGQVNSVEKAIDAYRALNHMYGRAVDRTDKIAIKNLKDRVYSTLKDNASSSTIKLLDKTNENYSRLMNQKDAMKILGKSMKELSSGSDIGSVKAVNWGKLRTKLKESNIDSPEANALLDLAEEYTKKFSDRDITTLKLTNTTPEGQVDSLATDPTGFWARIGVSKLGNWMLDHIPFNDAAGLRRAQRNIAKAIRSSTTPEEMMAIVEKSSFNKKNIRAQTESILRAEGDNASPSSMQQQVMQNSSVNKPLPLDSTGNAPARQAVQNNAEEAINTRQNIIDDTMQTDVNLNALDNKAKDFFGIDGEVWNNMSPNKRASYIEEMKGHPSYRGSAEEIPDAVPQLGGDIPVVQVAKISSEPINRASISNPTSAMRDGRDIVYSGGARATRNNNGEYEIRTSASSNGSEIRQIIDEVLTHQPNGVKVTSSNGEVSKVVTSSNGAEEYMARTAANRQVARPSSSMGQPRTTTTANSRSTEFEPRTSPYSNTSTDGISSTVSASSEQVIPSIGKVKFTQDTTRLYTGNTTSGGRGIEKVILELRERGLNKDKAYKMIDEFVNGGNAVNRGKALEVRIGARGYIFNPNSSVEDRLIELGLKQRANSTPSSIYGRKSISGGNRAEAISDIVSRVNENVNNRLGFKAAMNDAGDAIVIKDVNGISKGHFRIGSNGVLSATTTSLTKGSGEGQRVYSSVWDAIEGTGLKYKPTTGLSQVNRYRMTANMLKYLAERTNMKEAPHLLLSYIMRGSDTSLDGLPLNKKNALRLLDGFKESIRTETIGGRYGLDLTARTTNDELKRMAKKLGKSDKTRVGLSTLMLVRGFLRTGGLTSGMMAFIAMVYGSGFDSLVGES